jgi:hypothetical protein
MLRRLFVLALFGVVAEASSWSLAPLISGRAYACLAVFHYPAEALRFGLFRTLENHPSPLDNALMMLVFFGEAALQWCLILLVGQFLVGRCARNRKS